jgi:hypothetical protein
MIPTDTLKNLAQQQGGSVMNMWAQIAVLPDGTTKVLSCKCWADKGNPNHNLVKKQPKKKKEEVKIENVGVVEL